MPLVIPDETLKAAGLDEREAKIEIACQFFTTGRLALWPAAQLAGLDREAFQDELRRRGLPVHNYTEEDLRRDAEAIEHLAELRKAGR